MTGRTLLQYRVDAKLGEGGMGVVYEALDTRLERRVAIKVLSDPLRGRQLLAEARAAAHLNHPNIVTVHEIGSADGVDFLVMERVIGQTLQDYLMRGPMDRGQVIPLARQIAAALQAAHRAGILHRDLKPANIMVSPDGFVKVMDFGLAKGAWDTRPDATQTQQGRVTGTPAYMSPEQAQGKTLDVRSDVFSFGAVLYEMVSGKRAFPGDSPITVLTSVLRDEPLPLLPGTPLAALIHRCLAKDPAVRPATMTEVLAALDLPSGESPMASVPAEVTQPAPSLAVLPFINLSANPANDFFSDGLAEEVLNAVAKVPGWRVAARTSAFAFRGRDVDLRRVGQTLNVDHVLEGSVRSVGDQVRVTAQLVKTADGFQIWSERYDRRLTDIFEIQDDIAQEIVKRLRGQLSSPGGSLPISAGGTRNVEAYQAYWRARYHFSVATRESLALARQEYETAILLDPTYAEAHAGLAGYYNFLSNLRLAKTREASPLAIHSARQALALNPNLAEAHEVLGISRVLLDYDWAEAEASFRTALACADSSSRTRHRFAFHVLLPTGRLEEALAMGRRALDEDPLALLNYVSLAFTLLSMRRYTDCIAECRKALNINPSYWPLRAVQAMVNLELGQAAQAVENLEAARTTMPSSDWLHAIHALALRRMGRGEEAAKVLSAGAIREPSALAVYHIDDEDLTRFFDYCEEAVEGRDPNLARLAVEPFYDRIRVHPRYSELLRQLNLTRLLPHG